MFMQQVKLVSGHGAIEHVIDGQKCFLRGLGSAGEVGVVRVWDRAESRAEQNRTDRIGSDQIRTYTTVQTRLQGHTETRLYGGK